MRDLRTRWQPWAALLMGLLMVASATAQDYGARLGTVKRGGRLSFEPTGPGILFDALDPALRKWYVPQELYTEYQWKQWKYTNYARQSYQRYVSTSLEGDYWYDAYGNLLTQGWLIYDWRQQNPAPFGSVLEKSDRFSKWFSSVVVASDHKGQSHFAITVGTEIRATLTPMTFSKPRFNGVQWDFASDKYTTTLLASRISEPNSPGNLPEGRTSNTNLFGGRAEAQVGDFARVGATFVSAHHSLSQLAALNGSVFSGALAEGQNDGTVTRVGIRITDDSPADGEGGGALFASDLVIHDRHGGIFRASEIGFRPTVAGGFQRPGFLAADGFEEIFVTYDFGSRTYTGPDPTDIKRVEVELVLANDFRVDVASNRQLNARGAVIFLPVRQAAGNVKDGSNQQVLQFDYGVPTANQLMGFTVEMTDLQGLDGYLEVNVNHRFTQYPNPAFQRHESARESALGWFLNVSRKDYPWFAFLEAFRIDAEYATSLTVVDEDGVPDYGNPRRIYEFVDDNDDVDRFPDWTRSGSTAGDKEVFPGLDENNDRIWDFNQNDNEDRPNLIPDYEEPFLRYFTDRPEFLYGVDANHNGTVDRFENDEYADLPYRRDQKGYNLYGGFFLGPDLRFTAGRLRVEQLSDDRHNRAWYGMLTLDTDLSVLGRVRAFQDLRRVRDTIADDLFQWTQRPNTRGDLVLTRDELPAQDTWVNTTWLGLNQRPVPGLKLEHKLKWQSWRQQDADLELELREQRDRSSFFGLINKAEYTLNVGKWTFAPRWKSEWRRQTPVVTTQARRDEITELFMLVSRHPIMHSSFVEAGLEYEAFHQRRKPLPAGANPSFRGMTTTVQMTNLSDYLGYVLTTTIGFEITRIDLDFEPTQTRTRGFVTIYAGVER
ncbi:MAG: hypothetical protein HN712_17605 [Gemmatimonadetes bacterium]|nr:hypothetical protein [Gemmatimonadota bacterium]MBT7862137.1 hypothetical protein [Gemmatimonadota bacterium]